MFFQPDGIKITAAALAVDATVPMAIARDAFHFGLRAKYGHVFLALFGLSAKHHARVPIDFPFHVAGENKIGVVNFIGRKISAVGSRHTRSD